MLFSQKLWEHLQTGHCKKEDLHERVTKGQIGSLLQQVYQQCDQEILTEEMNKASTWAREFIKNP